MVPCTLGHGPSLSLQTDGSKNLKTIILKHFNRFSSYMRRLGIEVKSNESYSNNIGYSLTEVTLKPQCFTVDFNQNFVRITALR